MKNVTICLLLVFLFATTSFAGEAVTPPDADNASAVSRGIIADGGAETCEAALAAALAAVKRDDADALWKMLSSEARYDITAEISGYKLNCILGADNEAVVRFLGGNSTETEVTRLLVPRALLEAAKMNTSAITGRAWQRSHETASVAYYLGCAGDVKPLAVTPSKDGLVVDYYCRTADGTDVHVWFVREAGRWFLHSVGGPAPVAEWPMPEYVTPDAVDVKLDTPVNAAKSFMRANLAGNLAALHRCLAEADRKEQLRIGALQKAIAAGVPSDQDSLRSPYLGLTWREMKILPLEKIVEGVRIPARLKEYAALRSKPFLEATVEEVENDSGKAKVKYVFPEESGYPEQEIELSKESDGWKVRLPEPPGRPRK